ncbi:MAG: alpha/beta hydrolase family protein [Gammaproteobacteria bacterium]|nr:alpha/beta hydrolase family protein [Gammaproteobacteria bacterium]
MNISAINPRFTLKKRFLGILTSLIFLMVDGVFAENISSEKRWAEQLRDNIVIGEPIDLPLTGAKSGATSSATENTFFSIFTPHTTAAPKGAVILMHGTGAHPDWSDIIHPLRSELPDKGWATLSIQLPLALPERKDDESLKKVIESSTPRIEAAINYLSSQKYGRIIIISHSFGSLMALNFLQLKVDAVSPEGIPLISAAVIIGTPSSGSEAPFNSPAMIEKIKIPLLDLYGSNDLDKVLRSAKARKVAANKAKNKKYRQSQTIGANHFYNGLDSELIIYIANWLNKTFSP